MNEQDKKNLADCLKEKKAVLYGASWCGYTRKQLDAFGSAKSSVEYVECSDSEGIQKCKDKGVTAYPTWHIGGKEVLGMRDLESLQRLSQCDLKNLKSA